MVFKKPYAFLIKHFRFIHIVLSILLGALLYKTYDVYTFYNDYFNQSGFTIIDDISNILITPIMYIYIILIIGITFTIYLLMNFKKKNTKYYFVSIIYYFLMIFVFIFVKYQLKQLELDIFNIRMIKITRDILLVSNIFQIPFLLVSIVRAIGFNIKKFNFEKDIKELEISELDSEEIEVGINLDNNDIKTIINRRKRLFKYFFKENKYMVLLVISLVMISSGIIFYINSEVKNKIYKVNEELNTNSIKLKVLNSYNLTTNTSNNDIGNNVYNYIVVKILITNKIKSNFKISVNNFRLKTGEYSSYNVDIDNYNNFLEFGIPYNDSLKSLESKEYMLVFKVKKEESRNTNYLEYLTSVKTKNNEVKYNYAKFKLEYEDISKDEKMIETGLNNKISFSKSLLKNSSIIISDVEFNNSFTAKSKSCINNKCYDSDILIIPSLTSSYKKTVMKVSYELDLDNNINTNLRDKFISKFGNLRYIINNKEYNHDINLVDITPIGISDTSYLEVKDEVSKATKIYLDFRIRNKIYTYIIKG